MTGGRSGCLRLRPRVLACVVSSPGGGGKAGGVVPLFVDVDSAIPVVVDPDAAAPVYSPELAALDGLDASGVYVILSRSGGVLYVGESHTGRLYATITRHFRRWSRPRGAYANGRASGGVSYDRRRCLVAWRECLPEQCAALQWAEIVRLRPRDNEVAATPPEVREALRDQSGPDWEVPF